MKVNVYQLICGGIHKLIGNGIISIGKIIQSFNINWVGNMFQWIYRWSWL